MAPTSVKIIAIPGVTPTKPLLTQIRDFANKLQPIELSLELPLVILRDKRSNAFYVNCRVSGETLSTKTDADAVLDPDESEDYKLNRNIYTDTYAYKIMEKDATLGRSFEDIVTEYDTSYRSVRPLKVYGGQHRVMAIQMAMKKGVNVYHGIRVYFGLTTDQRLEVATVNNTSIAIANDLLDRMQEDWLGKELRQWCQSVGLLEDEENFADKRSSDGIPTVRVARTLVVNYFRGMQDEKGTNAPKVCSSGAGIDPDYEKLRGTIKWANSAFLDMGRQFAKLHKLQRERVTARKVDSHQEFANKAVHPCVVAAWAYTAGMLHNNSVARSAHYELPESVGTRTEIDPLNAKALSSARLKGVDPDTYRGLGARINTNELGRMRELFFLQATKASKRGITPKLANAAIQAYEAKKAQSQAERAIESI